MAEELLGRTQRFPIISVEDAMAEDDWAGWRMIRLLRLAAELGDRAGFAGRQALR